MKSIILIIENKKNASFCFDNIDYDGKIRITVITSL
jgi:hypothetical protein